MVHDSTSLSIGPNILKERCKTIRDCARTKTIDYVRNVPKGNEAVGLVNRAVSPDELDAIVGELSGRLAKAATRALGLAKDAVNRGADLPIEEGLKIEARNFARASLSEDAVIGIVSFLSKIEPEFKGK